MEQSSQDHGLSLYAGEMCAHVPVDSLTENLKSIMWAMYSQQILAEDSLGVRFQEYNEVQIVIHHIPLGYASHKKGQITCPEDSCHIYRLKCLGKDEENVSTVRL